MEPKNLTIYAGTVLGRPVRWTSQCKIVPVLCGRKQLRAMDRQVEAMLGSNKYVFDDGEPSVYNKNWADLSCIETVLQKEFNSELNKQIGNAQYRRAWAEDAIEPSNPDVLYVPEPAVFGCSLKEQFKAGHAGFPGYELSMEAAHNGLFPLSEDELSQVWNQNQFHGCLMARGPARLYLPFMNTLISSFCWPLWSEYKDVFVSFSGYNARGLAFLAERLFTAMVLYRDKLGLGEIQTAPIVFYPD